MDHGNVAVLLLVPTPCKSQQHISIRNVALLSM